jgi:hypothetical protein
MLFFRSADTALRDVCAGSLWLVMTRSETSRAIFVGDIESPSCGTLLRKKDKPISYFAENGVIGSFDPNLPQV